jgi:glycosyltransferase involved in cell wall biosynthesis
MIIPVYNEAPHLERFFEHVFSKSCPIEREWIVIDDASTDGSGAVLQKLAEKYPFRYLRQDQNQGKGAAIMRGIREASGDFLIIQDADFEYDPDDIPAVLEPLIQNRADVVYGSRFKKSAQQVHRTYHYFVNRFLTLLSNLLSGLYLTDMETCYKAFRMDLVKSMKLRSKRFGIEIEFTAYIAKARARVFEIPIHYYPRTRLQGKKIGWRDGVAALYHLIDFNCRVSFSDAFENLPERYRP